MRMMSTANDPIRGYGDPCTQTKDSTAYPLQALHYCLSYVFKRNIVTVVGRTENLPILSRTSAEGEKKPSGFRVYVRAQWTDRSTVVRAQGRQCKSAAVRWCRTGGRAATGAP